MYSQNRINISKDKDHIAMALNSQHALEEFRENIINRDIIKASLILDQIDQIADREQIDEIELAGAG